MNDNVQILEGNTTRRISPIDKIEVDTTTEGETSMWVPKDDHTTGVLYASENGIYIASEDGYDSYSEVVIRVEKRIDDGDLTDESGTDWKDIDFDGDVGNFDELDNWDVDTLEEFSDDLEGFDDLFNDEDKWDEEKEKPITEDEMDDFTGDSISGIDPEDGNVYEYSVDEDGNLTEAMLPSAIHIVIAPRKKDYVAGETIDFSGIHVYLLDGNNHLFTNEQYPTGEIPFEELLLPVTIAEGDEDETGESHKKSDIGEVTTYTHIDAQRKEGTNEYYIEWNTVGNSVLVIQTTHLNRSHYHMVSDNPEDGVFQHNTSYRDGELINESTQTVPIGEQNHFTHDGKTIYYMGMIGSYWTSYEWKPEITDSHTVTKEELWTAFFGESEGGGKNMIPVQWMRSDGETLEDRFKITVTERNTDESSSGTSDSGSGHTSGGF